MGIHLTFGYELCSWSEEKPAQDPESWVPVDRVTPAEDASGFVDPIISIMKQSWMNDSQEGFSEEVADNTHVNTGVGLAENFGYYQPTYESYFPRSSRPVKESRRKEVGSMYDSGMKDVFEPPVSSPYSDPPVVFVEPDAVDASYFPNVSRIVKESKQNSTGESASIPTAAAENFGFPLFESKVDVSSVQRETDEEQWLTVEEVQLVTEPSTLPPPNRPAPSLPNEPNIFSSATDYQQAQSVPDYKSDSSQDAAEDLPFYQQRGSPLYATTVENDVMAAAAARGIDGLEEFMASVLHKSEASTGGNDRSGYQGERRDNLNQEEVKLRQVKEVKEKFREQQQREAMTAKSVAREREGWEAREQILREAREKQEREREKQEKEKQMKEEKERQRRERLREREKEREKDRAAERAAVERATAEARARAAAEAKERAERAAVERAAAEARERAAVEAKERAERAAAERAAVERAAAEARDRAAAEARERAERAATEARQKAERAAVERATAEARERAAAEARARAAADARARAERAAAESAAAEARERAAAEARERAERAASERAREQQRRNDNDLDRLFNMGTRANSEPRQRPQNFVGSAPCNAGQSSLANCCRLGQTAFPGSTWAVPHF